MPQTVADYISAMEHAIGGAPDSRIDPVQVLNEAVRYLFDSHPWSWRGRPILQITTTPGQNFVALPADFGEILSVHFDTREVSLTSLQDIAHRRANTLIPPPLAAVYCAVSFPGQPTSTSSQYTAVPTILPSNPTIPSGSLTASATDWLSGPFTPNFALDGNTNTFWEAGSNYTTAGFFELDAGASVTMGFLSLQTLDTVPTQFPPQGIVETSPDNATWTQVATWDVTTSQFNPATKTVIMTWSPASARYIRVRPSATMSTFWAIVEAVLAPSSVTVTQPTGPLLEIFPNVTTADNYTIEYRAGAIQLVNQTDVPNIPLSFERLLTLIARAFMQDYEEQDASSEWAKADIETEKLKGHDGLTQQNLGLVLGGAVNDRRRRVNFWVGGINPR